MAAVSSFLSQSLLNSSSSSTGTAISTTDERLAAAAALDAAEEQLQTLTAAHAGTFVSVERRSAAFQAHLQQLLTELEAVTAQTSVSLQVLEQQQQQQQQEDEDHHGRGGGGGGGEETLQPLAVLTERHRVRRRTLLQHSSLLELLELPNIMDACVRSNLYEEALQIAAFSNTLARRHGTDNSSSSNIISNNKSSISSSSSTSNANAVVQQVICQIRSRQVDLRRHLLGRLRVSVTMPECLEVVTAVRRLNAIDLETTTTTNTNNNNVGGGGNNLEQAHAATEYQLQISFLEARDVWLDSKTAASSSSSSNVRPTLLMVQAEPLLDAIERYRTRMFEVATQFNAIFRAQHQHSSASAASSTQLLALWTTRRVQSFLQLLRTELLLGSSSSSNNTVGTSGSSSNYAPQDAAAIRDAVEASVFFGASLGRLGADFTCQLAAIFEPVLLQTVTQPWKEGVAQLRETLTVCREAGVAGPLATEVGTSSSSSSADEFTASGSTASASMLEGPQPAPKKLLALPPLARLTNAVLTGLNELRRCLLPGIFPALRRCLDEQLEAVRAELLANERIVLTPGLRGEAAALRAIATELRSVFRDIVEPYLRGSLEAAIGNATAAVKHHQLLRNNLLQRERAQQQQVDGSKEEEAVAEEETANEVQDAEDKTEEGVDGKEVDVGGRLGQDEEQIAAVDEGNDGLHTAA